RATCPDGGGDGVGLQPVDDELEHLRDHQGDDRRGHRAEEAEIEAEADRTDRLPEAAHGAAHGRRSPRREAGAPPVGAEDLAESTIEATGTRTPRFPVTRGGTGPRIAPAAPVSFRVRRPGQRLAAPAQPRGAGSVLWDRLSPAVPVQSCGAAGVHSP